MTARNTIKKMYEKCLVYYYCYYFSVIISVCVHKFTLLFGIIIVVHLFHYHSYLIHRHVSTCDSVYYI